MSIATSLAMVERELHFWCDYDDQGQRRVMVEAREPRSCNALLRDKRCKVTEQSDTHVLGEWTGGALPWKQWFPTNFRGMKLAETKRSNGGQEK